MAVEMMTIPDYHNQRRLPTTSTISLWEDRAIIYNEDKIESKILQPAAFELEGQRMGRCPRQCDDLLVCSCHNGRLHEHVE